MRRPHGTSFRNATVVAFSAASLVWMLITDCLAAGEAPARDPSRFALSRLVWLCRECHCWVESYRTLAQGLGLLVRHGVIPCSQIPVFRHGRWVLLTDDGLVTPTDPPVGLGTPDVGWALPGGGFAEILAGP